MSKGILFLSAICLFVSIPFGILEGRQDTAVEFLTFGIGGRASGMGEAFTAVASDSTAIYWNPAGLGFLRNPEFGTMYYTLYPDLSTITQDMFHSFSSLIFPLGEKTTYGIGINYIQLGTHTTTNRYNEVTGRIRLYDVAGGISLARLLNKDLSLGVSLKYIYSDYWMYKGTSFAGDLGILYRTPIHGLRLGLCLENIGPKIFYKDEYKADTLPQNLRIGASYGFLIKGNNGILFATDLNRPFYDAKFLGLNTGVECTIFNLLMARVGYFNKGEGWKGVTYGVGLRYRGYQVDFSDVPGGDLGRNNKISLIIRF
ncbi:MAG: PorV/PorQ family protein [bacterium]|nr:PorV/PorQ family protein [bacterium]